MTPLDDAVDLLGLTPHIAESQMRVNLYAHIDRLMDERDASDKQCAELEKQMARLLARLDAAEAVCRAVGSSTTDLADVERVLAAWRKSRGEEHLAPSAAKALGDIYEVFRAMVDDPE